MLASDHTGTIGIILYDREVRRVIGESVFELQCKQMQVRPSSFVWHIFSLLTALFRYSMQYKLNINNNLTKQEGNDGKFPAILLSLEKLSCKLTLSLKRSQSQKKTNIFHASDLSISPKNECISPISDGDTYIRE